MTSYRHRCTIRKTDTFNCLHYSSLHPDHYKGAIPYSQFLRLRRICSDDANFTKRAAEIKEYFRARGDPDELVNNDLRKVPTARSSLLKSTPRSHDESTNTKVPLVLMYNHSTPAPDGSCLTISTCCPPIRSLYHIGASETSMISLYTLLRSRRLSLMPVHCPADGLDARSAST